MKAIALSLLLGMFLPQTTETPVQYERGVVTPFSRATAARPFLNADQTSIELTIEQRAEIRVAMAELKTARAELRVAELELNLKIQNARQDQGVPDNWVWHENVMRFVKPLPQPEIVRPPGGRP